MTSFSNFVPSSRDEATQTELEILEFLDTTRFADRDRLQAIVTPPASPRDATDRAVSNLQSKRWIREVGPQHLLSITDEGRRILEK